MRTIFATVSLAVVSLVAVGAVLHHGIRSSQREEASSRRPVIVELFTSEGCSSCPPADTLLAALAEKQPVENADVIALEEHVDYWNDLGWADPFSSRDWTTRQYVYSGALGNGNPYTPQMIVDGTVEFVGSRARKARQAIQEAAGEEKIEVTLAKESPNNAGAESFSVKVGKLAGTTKGDAAEVWLAVTETGLHSAVTRGENAGEDLHHAAVVRTMRRIGEAKGGGETSFAGDASLPLRAEWKRESLRVVVFVQEKKSRRILGGAEMRVAQ